MAGRNRSVEEWPRELEAAKRKVECARAELEEYRWQRKLEAAKGKVERARTELEEYRKKMELEGRRASRDTGSS